MTAWIIAGEAERRSWFVVRGSTCVERRTQNDEREDDTRQTTNVEREGLS